jgi:hypothetical protein
MISTLSKPHRGAIVPQLSQYHFSTKERNDKATMKLTCTNGRKKKKMKKLFLSIKIDLLEETPLRPTTNNQTVESLKIGVELQEVVERDYQDIDPQCLQILRFLQLCTNALTEEKFDERVPKCGEGKN